MSERTGRASPGKAGLPREVMFELFGGKGFFTAEQMAAILAKSGKIKGHLGTRRAHTMYKKNPEKLDGMTPDEINLTGLRVLVYAFAQAMKKAKVGVKMRGEKPNVSYALPAALPTRKRSAAVGFGAEELLTIVRDRPGVSMEELIDEALKRADRDGLLKSYAKTLRRPLSAAERAAPETLRAAGRTAVRRALNHLASRGGDPLREDVIPEQRRFYPK